MHMHYSYSLPHICRSVGWWSKFITSSGLEKISQPLTNTPPVAIYIYTLRSAHSHALYALCGYLALEQMLLLLVQSQVPAFFKVRQGQIARPINQSPYPLNVLSHERFMTCCSAGILHACHLHARPVYHGVCCLRALVMLISRCYWVDNAALWVGLRSL